MRSLFLLLLIFLFNSCSVYNEHINPINLKKHVKYLASDQLEGRYPASAGGLLAAEYIRDYFSENGLVLYDQAGFQYFNIITNSYLGPNNQLTFNNNSYVVSDDFIPLSYGLNTTLNSEIYFAGYGFNINNDSLIWNDYQNYNSKDKWVMIFRGSPDNDNPHGDYASYSSLRKKAIIAKDNGASGVIFVSTSGFDAEDKLIELSYDQSQNDIGIPIIHIKRDLANLILKDNNKTVDILEDELINKLNKFENFTIDKSIKITSDVLFETKQTQNVIGFIPGSDNTLKDEYIVVGAHYDHIGYGGEGSSSRRPYIDAIHNGADDNASGVSVILELSKMLKNIKTNRTIYFVAFGAEEMGLIGSKYFVNNQIISDKKIQIMINLDMVGRLKNNVVSINGVETAKNLKKLISDIVQKNKIEATFSSDGFGPSDHSSFYIKDIPVLYFFTGAHNDYHTPNDDYEKINYLGLEKIENLVYSSIVEFDKIEKLEFTKSGEKESSRPPKFKVTLGIMPDYVFKDIKGLRIDAVTPNRPAYNAGLIDGDIIIQMDGKSVSDIYEYMHRLSEIEIGDTIDVKVIRDNKELTFPVTF